MEFLSDTVKGLEDIAAKEIEGIGGKIKEIGAGYIIYEGSRELIFRANYLAKNIERVVIILQKGLLGNEEELELPDFLKNAEECSLSMHIENSPMSREKIREYLMNKMKQLCKAAKEVKKGKYLIFSYIKDNMSIVGLDTTGAPLRERGYFRFRHPASLNPLIANAMVKIGGEREIIDPFCGSGTILIEAYNHWSKTLNVFRTFQFSNISELKEEFNEQVEYMRENKGQKENKGKYYGIDINKRYIVGAQDNARAAKARISCTLGNAEKLHRYVDSGKLIITNPPYGLREKKKKEIFKLYENFALELEEHFSGGNIVIITPYEKFEHYFTVLEKRKIQFGKLAVWLYKFKI